MALKKYRFLTALILNPFLLLTLSLPINFLPSALAEEFTSIEAAESLTPEQPFILETQSLDEAEEMASESSIDYLQTEESLSSSEEPESPAVQPDEEIQENSEETEEILEEEEGGEEQFRVVNPSTPATVNKEDLVNALRLHYGDILGPGTTGVRVRIWSEITVGGAVWSRNIVQTSGATLSEIVLARTLTLSDGANSYDVNRIEVVFPVGGGGTTVASIKFLYRQTGSDDIVRGTANVVTDDGPDKGKLVADSIRLTSPNGPAQPQITRFPNPIRLRGLVGVSPQYRGATLTLSSQQEVVTATFPNMQAREVGYLYTGLLTNPLNFNQIFPNGVIRFRINSPNNTVTQVRLRISSDSVVQYVTLPAINHTESMITVNLADFNRVDLTRVTEVAFEVLGAGNVQLRVNWGPFTLEE